MAADSRSPNALPVEERRYDALRRRLLALPWFALLTWGALLIVAALRLRHYLANRSLWLDEALLANALLSLPPGTLGPLANNQAVPAGFLFAVRGAVASLGDGEFGLRLPAMLCALAALPLLAMLARRTLSAAAVPLAAVFFALAAPQIYFAAEFKPYGPDVFVALLISLLAVALLANSSPALVVGASLGGALLIWCSFPAVFVAAGVALALLGEALLRRDQAALVVRTAVALIWLGSFLACYLLTIRPQADNNFLRDYWGDAFAPLPPRSFGDLRWYLEQPLSIFGADVAGFILPGMAVLVALFGVAALLARGRAVVVALLALPAAAVLAASALGRYPFEGRLLLFLAPAVILLVAEGVIAIANAARPNAAWLAPAVALLLVTGLVVEARGLIVAPAREELRPVLAHVAAEMRPTDTIYIYYGAEAPARYYAPRLGLDPAQLVYGQFVRADLPAIAAELASLSDGDRVWFVFSHVHVARGVDEEQFALYLLDGAGTRLDSIRRPDAAAYLYEFRP
jgi:hypothetical protein